MKQKKARLSKNDGNARKVFFVALLIFFALLIKDASSGVFYEKILNKRNWQEVLVFLDKLPGLTPDPRKLK